MPLPPRNGSYPISLIFFPLFSTQFTLPTTPLTPIPLSPSDPLPFPHFYLFYSFSQAVSWDSRLHLDLAPPEEQGLLPAAHRLMYLVFIIRFSPSAAQAQPFPLALCVLTVKTIPRAAGNAGARHIPSKVPEHVPQARTAASFPATL